MKSLDIVTNMFISTQQRNVNEVKELLMYEVELPPPALISPTTGAVRFAAKAQLVDGLVEVLDAHTQPENSAIFMDRGNITLIIYASVMIRKNRPKKSNKTFAGYAEFLLRELKDDFDIFNRVDMVFDQYFDYSIKSITRTTRGSEEG